MVKNMGCDEVFTALHIVWQESTGLQKLKIAENDGITHWTKKKSQQTVHRKVQQTLDGFQKSLTQTLTLT